MKILIQPYKCFCELFLFKTLSVIEIYIKMSEILFIFNFQN